MKSFVWTSLVVLEACSVADRPGAEDQKALSLQSHLATIDAVATGSSCDVAGKRPVAPFPPAAETSGTTALSKDDSDIVAWADRVIDVDFGDGVQEQWKDVEQALGPAEGLSTAVVSLGEGGIITLGFASPIVDHPGYDFCVFENSFSDDFLELAEVEVATDEQLFIRFATYSKVSQAVDAYGTMDPSLVNGYAGKYRQGFCTPFDLSELGERPEVASGELDLSHIQYVRLRDVVGDGRELDCDSNPVFDPFPTTGGAGFDLDAIGVLSAQP